MQLIYEGKDIASEVDIQTCKIHDLSGEKFDSVEIIFNNHKNQWSSWKPEKNQMVLIKHEGFSSGQMYINGMQQLSGCIKMICLPVKTKAKEKHTKSWENVTLMELLNEIANKNALKLKTYNINNYRYHRLTQVEESDFVFISKRCMIEGYVMKITNNSLVVYDEKFMEAQHPIEIHVSDVIGEFRFYDGLTKTYSGARIGDYIYLCEDTIGPIINLDIETNSIGESERFAKNGLRSVNKYESIMEFDIKFNPGIAAGCTVDLNGFGLADNKYYVFQCTQNISSNLTSLKLRTIPGW
ncbi:hypothetical protein PBV87_12920 [Niameybacter massiliensis]|uniref:Uncharacterized protein n=1 Tax=Holtiella tumoricola TaxID=3018743 RepID=A0AA42J1Q6_9FIRM|nr:hypothetical protein [Holtiella tumoricola]MDA3732391.1 hypothetical protein [Holtiella tumoricola]